MWQFHLIVAYFKAHLCEDFNIVTLKKRLDVNIRAEMLKLKKKTSSLSAAWHIVCWESLKMERMSQQTLRHVRAGRAQCLNKSLQWFSNIRAMEHLDVNSTYFPTMQHVSMTKRYHFVGFYNTFSTKKWALPLFQIRANKLCVYTKHNPWYQNTFQHNRVVYKCLFSLYPVKLVETYLNIQNT